MSQDNKFDTDFLKEDSAKRFAGEGELDDLIKILDDDDEENYRKWQHLRDLASDKYDFSGFDHINCYTRENFASGVLEALENTRRRLSITTAEKLIDFLFIFGYTLKRICYIMFTQGYVNWNRRDVQNYINRNGYRLKTQRQELIDQMNQAVDGVFQKMKASVMKAEEGALNIYLRDIKRIQEALSKLDPVDESAKYNRLRKMMDELIDKTKSMHGIEELRKASIDISVHKEKKKADKTLELGFLDEHLREEAQQLPGIGKSTGGAIDAEVHVLD